jgi:hypothetical protein
MIISMFNRKWALRISHSIYPILHDMTLIHTFHFCFIPYVTIILLLRLRLLILRVGRSWMAHF